jgi:hypothetical protein
MIHYSSKNIKIIIFANKGNKKIIIFANNNKNSNAGQYLFFLLKINMKYNIINNLIKYFI